MMMFILSSFICVDEALCLAAQQGDVTETKRLLHSGADVSHQDSAGNTALHRAAAARHTPVIQAIREHCADGYDINKSAVLTKLNKKGKTALQEATHLPAKKELQDWLGR